MTHEILFLKLFHTFLKCIASQTREFLHFAKKFQIFTITILVKKPILGMASLYNKEIYFSFLDHFRYITNPLLLDKKKFDIRCYMLIANAVPYLVLFHQGYVRLTIHDYDNNSENLIAHLTNQVCHLAGFPATL